jgi:hypothetical protein
VTISSTLPDQQSIATWGFNFPHSAPIEIDPTCPIYRFEQVANRLPLLCTRFDTVLDRLAKTLSFSERNLFLTPSIITVIWTSSPSIDTRHQGGALLVEVERKHRALIRSAWLDDTGHHLLEIRSYASRM